MTPAAAKTRSADAPDTRLPICGQVATATGGTCRKCWWLKNPPNTADHTRPQWRRDEVAPAACLFGPLADLPTGQAGLDQWHYCIHFAHYRSVPQARRRA